jgi:hypothetical protein
MTGRPIRDSGDGIWDDGEWISWDYINQQLDEQSPEGGLVEDMILVSQQYFQETGRHLPIYGELGEHYAARRFSIELHKDSKAQGSDGRIGNELVEIKTISPLRRSKHVSVKASGNFGYLAIVRIDSNFQIDAKLIKRKRLGKTKNGYFVVSWDMHPDESNQAEQGGGGNSAALRASP